MGNIAIDELNKIREAEACGLTQTGDPKVPFIGDNKAWKKFDDGDFLINED